jgi:phosphomannomutase/phosphoglucomutase
MKINPLGFREYDARWLYPNDVDLEGIINLGKGLGTQIIKNLKKKKSENYRWT